MISGPFREFFTIFGGFRGFFVGGGRIRGFWGAWGAFFVCNTTKTITNSERTQKIR